MNASYNMPLSKFPLLDWTTVRGTYAATYTWTAASLLATNLGNIVGNTQNRQINGEFNFSQLYNKVKVLRILAMQNTSKPKGPANSNDKGLPPTKGGGMAPPDRTGKGGGGKDGTGRDGGGRDGGGKDGSVGSTKGTDEETVAVDTPPKDVPVNTEK